MASISTQQYLDISPKLVLEVACGIEEPAHIAERHGFSGREWDLLKQHEPFVKQVEAKKAELKASGYTFRMKSAIAAEDILEAVYKDATAENASFHTKLESLKFFAKAAGIDAPVKENVATGPAFSITINLGNGQSVQLGASGGTKAASEDIIDVDVSDISIDLPEVPPYMASADIKINMEACE